MKKFFSLLLALATIGSASASVILHESFDREVGTLNAGSDTDMGTNTADWWCFSGTSNYIQVAKGSLSYAGYASEGKGNKVALAGNGADDFRQFNAITSGKVYAAAIIRVDTLKGTTGDYFMALGDASNSTMVARLYIKGNADKTAFQLGISKMTDAVQYTTAEFALNTPLLVVMEYEIAEGEKNDTARLYINPTLKTTKASVVCDATLAAAKNDALKLASINLRQGTNTPKLVYIDEIKVATAWADLFEGGETPSEPSITVQDGFAFETELAYFTGDTYTGTLNISGKNLTEDITLTSSTNDITFSKTTITKEEAAAEGGVAITATLVPSDIEGDNYVDVRQATITLKSGDITKTVDIAEYYVFKLTRCENVAAMKAALATSTEEYTVYARLTGNAVVTYIQSGQWSKIYTIEDATGAINVEDETDYQHTANIALGDELTNILGYNTANIEFGIQPLLAAGLPFTVVSKNKVIEPQEVTLAELQANPADYLLELVKVKGVAFDETAVLFSAGSFPITQGEASASVNILAGNTLIGEAKPAVADVTGISSSATGKVIRPRSKEDVVVPGAVKAEIETGDLVFAEDFFYANETYTTTWNISGKNLSNDIVLSSSCEGLSFAPSTVKKEDAMAEGGATVTVTFAAGEPSGENYNGQETITLTSGETTEAYTVYGMFVYAPIAEFATISEALAAATDAGYIECTYTGNAIVTYILSGSWGDNTYTIEDESGAIELTAYDWGESGIALDNAISGFFLSVSTEDGATECYGMGEVTVDANPEKTITPAEITLEALLADSEGKYTNRLVVVKDIRFDNTEVLLGTGNTPITQGETVANINLPNENHPLVGTAKPTSAVDIIGVWATGLMGTQYLRPRTAADIIEHTAIENTTFDAETEIYTIQGMRVEALQPGVNIIRKGNTVYKVVR